MAGEFDEFEWDEAKCLSNLEKHGIDFEDAIGIFAGDFVEWRSDRDGEERWLTVGILDERFITIISTTRSTHRRIIAARRARQSEQRTYREAYPLGGPEDQG